MKQSIKIFSILVSFTLCHLGGAVSASDDAWLKSLALSHVTLHPAFKSTVLSYTTSVESSVSTVTVMATTNDTTAKFDVNGSPGTAQVGVSLGKAGTCTTINITVTAQSGAKKVYHVEVDRNTETNAWFGFVINPTIVEYLGWAGTALAGLMFLSPFPVFMDICKRGEIASYPGVTYVSTLFNCVLWVCYALYQGDLLQPLLTNLFGSALSLGWVLLWLYYAEGEQRWNVIKKTTILGIGTGAVLGVVQLQYFHFTVPLTPPMQFPAFFFGILCNIFCMIMYASPLSAMKQVIVTRSVEYLPFGFTFAAMMNALSWIGYGLYKADIMITVPNSIGLLFALAQMVLYIMYCRSTPRDDYERIVDPVSISVNNNKKTHRRASRYGERSSLQGDI